MLIKQTPGRYSRQERFRQCVGKVSVAAPYSVGNQNRDIRFGTFKDNYSRGSDINSTVSVFASGLSGEIKRELISDSGNTYNRNLRADFFQTTYYRSRHFCKKKAGMILSILAKRHKSFINAMIIIERKVSVIRKTYLTLHWLMRTKQTLSGPYIKSDHRQGYIMLKITTDYICNTLVYIVF